MNKGVTDIVQVDIVSGPDNPFTDLGPDLGPQDESEIQDMIVDLNKRRLDEAFSAIAREADQREWNKAADQKIKQREKSKSWRDNLFSASDLQSMEFEPVRYMLPGLIPEGIALLVGKPKIGKSWLALDLCLAAADGQRYTLGTLKPRHGDCLYLALEDNKRRLKKRINKLLPNDWSWPGRLTLVNEWKRSNEGGIADLRSWCKSVEKPTLIQIDTLQKFRPIQKGSDSYASDYAAVTELLSLTKEFPGLCVILLHHDRKMDAEDPFDTISGTLGLTGAVDTILLLKRNSGAIKLFVRGRDVEESETPLRFEKATCKWVTLNEADAEAAVSVERQTIIDVLAEFPSGLSLKDIAAATDREETPGLRKMLFDMTRDGQAKRVGRGVYGPCGNEGNISNKVTSNNQHVENIEENGFVTLVTDVTEVDPADFPAARWEREQ